MHPITASIVGTSVAPWGFRRAGAALAHLTRYGDWSVDALLDRFAELRRANLATLREWNLTQQQLASAGRHPDFGRVTLAQLLATWCV